MYDLFAVIIFLITFRGAQGILLVLHPGIIPEERRGHYGMPGCMQSEHPDQFTLSPAHVTYSSVYQFSNCNQFCKHTVAAKEITIRNLLQTRKGRPNSQANSKILKEKKLFHYSHFVDEESEGEGESNFTHHHRRLKQQGRTEGQKRVFSCVRLGASARDLSYPYKRKP